MLLSPEQFSRLSEYAAYSRRKLKDMLSDFQQDGKFFSYLSEDGQTINIDGFRAFLIDYFGADLPSDLVDQLFLSFSKPPIKERRTSLFEDAISTVKAKFSESLSGRMAGLSIAGSSGSGQQTDRSTASEPQALVCIPEDDVMGPRAVCNGSQEPRIPLKPLICTLSLLEADTPENKLDVVFHIYDSDANGFLDKTEIDGIIEQMMNVARYQQWDTIELEQIIRQMMVDIDYDNDGIVSYDEWRRGGLTNIPLLVLLGFDTEMKEDGSHVWRLRHFTKPTYCNACCSILVGWGGKQGLSCSLCKYTVHERCVRSAATNCIRTFSSRQQDKLYHHWQDANATAKCVKCKATVGVFQGKGCRWCHNYVHHRCMSALAQECDLGALAHHILPPTHIFPAFLERKTSTSVKNHNFGSHSASLLQAISPSNDCRPLLVLVNPKSGGKQGVKILQKFEYLLNPRQVYDLSKTGPEPGLQLFSTLKNCNILVCGGDGTIGWVLESMDKMTFPHGRPPVSVLPLGTGNDLARCLRWGGGYENENLHKILEQIEKSSLIDMDRWQIKIEITESKNARRASEKGDTPPYSIINNYFSIGVDASIAHRFHVMREKFPEKFNSRMRNKLWYFELGTSETLSSSCKNLHEHIDVLCDGESIDLGQDASLEGIALLNIPSIYGGSNLWGRSRKVKGRMPGFGFPMKSAEKMQLQTRVQDIGDGLIELVGLESAMQMGQIKAGVRGARRLSQCSTVVIQTHKSFPMQIDGEPWMQPPCIIQITHKNQAKMLVAPRKRSSWMLLKRQSTNDDN